MPGPRPVAEVVADHIAVYLGPHTARVAVRTFSMKALKRGPETLIRADFSKLADALRPMLRTLVGRVTTEVILEQAERDLR